MAKMLRGVFVSLAWVWWGRRCFRILFCLVLFNRAELRCCILNTVLLIYWLQFILIKRDLFLHVVLKVDQIRRIERLEETRSAPIFRLLVPVLHLWVIRLLLFLLNCFILCDMIMLLKLLSFLDLRMFLNLLIILKLNILLLSLILLFNLLLILNFIDLNLRTLD